VPDPLTSALVTLGFTVDRSRASRTQDGVTERLDLTAWTVGPGYGGSRLLQVPREVDGAEAPPLVVGLPETGEDPVAHVGPWEEVGEGPYGLEIALPGDRWMLEPGGRIVPWPAPDDACAPDDEECRNALTMVLSAERATLPQLPDESEPRRVTCTVGLWDCVEDRLGAEHALEFLGDVSLTTVDDSVDEPAWTLTRFAIRTPDDLPLPPGAVAEPPFTLVERAAAPIGHPFSRAVLDATRGLVTASSDLDGQSLTVFDEPSAVWTTLRAPEAPPYVVCRDDERGTDRILQEAPASPTARVRTRTFFDVTTYFPTLEYTLPCEADLVIAADVEGIRPGERDPGRPAPPAPAITEFCPEEPDDVASNPERSRSSAASTAPTCTYRWRGDLNADGTEDVVLERVGEMGCGELTLHLSRPDGYAPAASWSWDC